MSVKMFVIGKTNLDTITIVSHERKFELNEYLVVEDFEGKDIVEVVETTSIPILSETSYTLLEQYKELSGEDVQNALYVSKARVLNEQKKPILSGSTARLATYEEVSPFILKARLNESMVLGQINGTNDLYDELPEELKNVAPMFFDREGFTSQNAVPLLLSARWSFEYPHTCYIGSSGSGKSHGLRVHCEEFMEKRMPSLFFDIHNEMVFDNVSEKNPIRRDYSKNHVLCKIGENVGIDFTELSIGELIGLLTFVADLTDSMKYALQAIYEKKDSLMSLKNRIVTLKEAFENQEKPSNQREDLSEEHRRVYMRYNKIVSGSATLQALLWRLNGLDKPTLFSNNSDLLETSLKQRKFITIQANNSLELKMYAYYILRKLYGKRRLFKESKNNSVEQFPPFTTFFDEAHNFAPNTPTSDPLKSLIKELAQEARKYGVFLVTATQRPALLDRTIMAQFNTKIIFRTTISEDIDMVSKETNLTNEETKRLPFLTAGQGFILNPKFGRTLYIRFRATNTISPHSLNPYDELENYDIVEDDEVTLIVSYLKELSPKTLPEMNLKPLQLKLEEELDKTYSIIELKEKLQELHLNGYIQYKKSSMGGSYFI